MFVRHAGKRDEEILVHNIIKLNYSIMKQKVLKKCMTPAEYQRLSGGEVLGT
jgi:hypothetical protein